jgi:hypothetical protein
VIDQRVIDYMEYCKDVARQIAETGEHHLMGFVLFGHSGTEGVDLSPLQNHRDAAVAVLKGLCEKRNAWGYVLVFEAWYKEGPMESPMPESLAALPLDDKDEALMLMGVDHHQRCRQMMARITRTKPNRTIGPWKTTDGEFEGRFVFKWRHWHEG